MITQGWFIREVLKKDFVPTCPQSPETNWGQNEIAKNRMDKGFQEYVPSVPSVPTKKEASCVLSGKDENKSQDLETICQWVADGGRPSNDYLCKLIIEKCERDPEARARFVQEAQATKARLLSNAEAVKHPIVNEKVIPLADRDYRRYCKDCVFLDHGGRCKQWQKTNPHNSRYRPVPDVLRNCSLFKPRE